MSSSIIRYRLTDHALFEMSRRKILEKELANVLLSPEQTIVEREGRIVYQSRIHDNQKFYLLRVFVDIDREPPEVVTVYRTSKIAKYWKVDE